MKNRRYAAAFHLTFNMTHDILLTSYFHPHTQKGDATMASELTMSEILRHAFGIDAPLPSRLFSDHGNDEAQDRREKSMAILMGNGDPTQGLHKPLSSSNFEIRLEYCAGHSVSFHESPLPPKEKPEQFDNAVNMRMVHVFHPGSAVRYTRHKGDKIHRGTVVDCYKEGYLVRHGRHKKNRSYVPFTQVFGTDGKPSYRYEVE